MSHASWYCNCLLAQLGFFKHVMGNGLDRNENVIDEDHLTRQDTNPSTSVFFGSLGIRDGFLPRS
jgi:hypothetical protein